ncbi:MAG: hypothetical protein JRN71_07695 [Nitrososphaerota archaeon]|nr:hypothetical protein [Nitrososphaerota archaeon]
MKSAVVFVVVAMLTVGMVGFQALQGSQPSSGVILWQDSADVRPCSGNATAQAVTVGAFGDVQNTGCGSTWLVLLPNTEGGSATAELSFYQAHRNQVSGVILDDFSLSASYYSFYSAHVNDSSVCPVVYLYIVGTAARLPQPAVTVGGACLILAVTPPPAMPKNVTGWETEIRAEMATLNARSIHLLAYGAPTSFWSEIPPAYLQAVANVSAQTGESEILWH